MPTTVIYVNHRRPLPLRGSAPLRGREAAQAFVNGLRGMQSGTGSSLGENFWLFQNDVTPQNGQRRAIPGSGYGIWQPAVASGVVGVKINGVDITVTASGGDTATSTALVTAINSSTAPLVQGYVTATNIVGTHLLSGAVAGAVFDVCGIKFTAVNGSRGMSPSEFDISSGGPANLTAAVNSHPYLYQVVRARAGPTSVRYMLLRPYDGKTIPAASYLASIGGNAFPPVPFAEFNSVHIVSLIQGAVSSMHTLSTAGAGTGQSILIGSPRFANYGAGSLAPGFGDSFGGV